MVTAGYAEPPFQSQQGTKFDFKLDFGAKTGMQPALRPVYSFGDRGLQNRCFSCAARQSGVFSFAGLPRGLAGFQWPASVLADPKGYAGMDSSRDHQMGAHTRCARCVLQCICSPCTHMQFEHSWL